MNLEWLGSAAPGLVVALAAGLFQYARVPTLNRRIERHVKLRSDLPESHKTALDDLLADEIESLVKRDRSWLRPKNIAAAAIRRLSTVFAATVAIWGFVYAIFVQSREDRLVTGNYGELASASAVGVLFVGYIIAYALDGVTPKDAMFGPAAAQDLDVRRDRLSDVEDDRG